MEPIQFVVRMDHNWTAAVRASTENQIIVGSVLYFLPKQWFTRIPRCPDIASAIETRSRG